MRNGICGFEPESPNLGSKPSEAYVEAKGPLKLALKQQQCHQMESHRHICNEDSVRLGAAWLVVRGSKDHLIVLRCHGKCQVHYAKLDESLDQNWGRHLQEDAAAVTGIGCPNIVVLPQGRHRLELSRSATVS